MLRHELETTASQRLGLRAAAGLTAALAVAGCSSGEPETVDSSQPCFGCGIETGADPGFKFGFDPQLNRALINDLRPVEEAREIGQALNAGYSVGGNLHVAYGYEIRWKQPKHNHTNIYPNSHIEQPFVFDDGVYGFVVGGWTGSMATRAQRHTVSITVFRTGLPLTPMTVEGKPVRHPHIGHAVVQLVRPPQPPRVPGAYVVSVPGTVSDPELATLHVGEQATNEGCCPPSADY
jgi:hypothetical protein